MKNDLLQISELKEELKVQQASLERKLDTQFQQILSILQASNPPKPPSTNTMLTSTTQQPTSNTTTPVVTPPKSSLKKATSTTDKNQSVPIDLTITSNHNDSGESIDFDYNLPSSIDEDDMYVGAMDVDITSGTKRQHGDSLQLRRSAPVPPQTPPTPNNYANYNSQSIVNSNSTNTTINGAQVASGSQKPPAVFIKSSALMTAHSSLSSPNGPHKSKSL